MRRALFKAILYAYLPAALVGVVVKEVAVDLLLLPFNVLDEMHRAEYRAEYRVKTNWPTWM